MLRTYHPLQPSAEGNYLVGMIRSTVHKLTGKRVTVYENTLLIVADSPRAALEKGIKIAVEANHEYQGEDGDIYISEFSGVTHLAPILGRLETGTEIAWLDLSGISDAALGERIMGATTEEAYKAFDAISEENSNYPPYVRIEE
jgi:hypothetical protein